MRMSPLPCIAPMPITGDGALGVEWPSGKRSRQVPQALRRQIGGNSYGLPIFNFPLSHFTTISDGHCTQSRKNWSNGQSNFAPRCAMLAMEAFQLSGHDRHSLLLHLGRRPNERTSGLNAPSLSLQKAKKRLIATVPNSKFGLTNWNHRLLAFSNRNTNTLFRIQIFSVSLYPERRRSACLSTLSGCEGRRQSVPVREGGSSIQPQASSFQNLIDTHLRIEFPLTRSKQTTVVLSNRYKFPPPRPVFRYNGSNSSNPVKSSPAERN
jgi:hypothetical protein